MSTSLTDIPNLAADDYQSFNSSLETYDTTNALISSDNGSGANREIRAPYVNLSDVSYAAGQTKISVYADTVDFKPGPAIFVLPPRGQLELFGRAILRRSTAAAPFKVRITDVYGFIMIYNNFTSDSGTQIHFELTLPDNTKQKVSTQFKPDTIGQAITWVAAEGVQVKTTPKPPKTRFDVPSIAEEANEDPVLVAAGFKKYGNLPRLLRYQLCLAAAWQERHPAIAIDIARFVSAITTGIPKAVEFHAQAAAYLSSMLFGGTTDSLTGTNSRLVPSVDLSSTKLVLTARLVAATAFEQSYQQFVQMDVNSKNLRIMANVALEASKDTQASYEFIGNLTEQRYEEAKASLAEAHKNFNSLKKDLPDLQQKFKDGIESWKKKQTWKMIGEAFLGVLALTGAVLTAVVPGGQAAGAAAGAAAVAQVANGVANATETISRMAKVMIKIKDILEKMIPILEKIQALVEKIGEIISLVKKLDASRESSEEDANKMAMPTDGATDIINLGVKWDEFLLDVNDLMSTATSEGIDGAGAYHMALQKLCIRAKAILAAQAAVTQAGDEYMKTLTMTITHQRQTERLGVAIKSLAGNEKMFVLFKEAFLERLLTLRTWIALDFSAYITAYMYYSLARSSPVHIDPVKPIMYYNSDAALLQAAVSEAEVHIRPQLRTFKLKIGDVDPNWKAALTDSRKLEFALPSTYTIFGDYARVRVNGIRCYLDGASKVDHPVRVYVGFDGRLADKNITSSRDEVFFITSPRTVAFEYSNQSETNDIVVDGTFARNHTLLKPTPFTTWTLSVPDKTIDLSSVTDIRLEFACEVTITVL